MWDSLFCVTRLPPNSRRACDKRIHNFITGLKIFLILAPSNLINLERNIKRKIWEIHTNLYINQQSNLEKILERIYFTVFVNCVDVIQDMLYISTQFDIISYNHDFIILFNLIKIICLNFKIQKYPILTIHKSVQILYIIHQDKYNTCE